MTRRSRAAGRGGLAIAVDVLGIDEDPPITKAAVDASGHATFAFAK